MAWIIENDQLTNTDFISLPDEPFKNDSPYTMWRIEQLVNNGKPFTPLMVDLPRLEPAEPVIQKGYITVHDMRTAQNGFDNNGLAVLMPTQCRVTEELNGDYSVYLEHPIDPYGKWVYIMEMNYLKVFGQIFYIYKVTQTYTGAVGKINVWARHVFYNLNDRWIFSTESLSSPTMYGILNAAYNAAQTKARFGDINYTYQYNTDLEDDPNITKYEWQELTSGMTFGDFVLGSNGFISACGGELYRDNFYFSINERKQYTKDNAFELRIGLNMKGVQRTVDTSQMCTWCQGQDAYGNKYSVGVAQSDTSLPRHIVRQVDISDDVAGMDAVKEVVTEYFNEHKMPKVVWTINVYDLQNNPDYQGYTNNFEFEVGDKGMLFEDRINAFGGISTQKVEVKVTKVVKDGITGDVLEVQFGDKSYVTHPKKYRKIKTSEEAEYNSELQEVAFYALIQTPIMTIDGECLTTSDYWYITYEL